MLGDYPRLAAYLEQLPEGLDSHPSCLAKVSIHRTVQAHANQRLCGLPSVLQAHLDESAPVDKWMPQCHSLALIIALVEARRLPPDEEAQWIRGAASLLFSTPMFKLLLWAISPRLMIKGADIRWSAFFRGSNLQATLGEREADVELLAPPGLFDPTLACIFADVLRAALRYAEYDASTTELELVGFEPGCVRYVVSW
ncbi:MAG TPA: hypothetical protein VM869_14200 [Enhygromyxa sp.]|nr:hypothetical protein [Enhygromyxa sp.]